MPLKAGASMPLLLARLGKHPSLMPPAAGHYGRSTALTVLRGVALDAAFVAHPARFKGIAPRPPSVPLAIWINPPKKENTPTTITLNCSLSS